MNRKIYLGVMLCLLTIVLMEPAFCDIVDDNIRRASASFVSTLKDWSTPVIIGGLFGSGVCLFTSNYRMGLAGLAGTGFLYAAKEFADNGSGILLDMAMQLVG